MFTAYMRLRNVVDCRNEVSIRWLKRLGAAFDAPRPMGRLGLPFMPFEIRRDKCVIQP